VSAKSGPRRGAKARLRRRLVAVTAAGITLLAGLMVAVAAGLVLYFGPGPRAVRGAATTLILPPGAGVPEIATDLRRAGVVGSGSAFIVAAELTGVGRRLKAGEYAFASRTSLRTVLDAIAAGRVVRHFITIPEGFTSEGVMETLMRADFLSGVAPAPPEGSVLPETYEVRRGDDRSAVLRRLMDARDKLLATLWAHRRPRLPYQTPEDAVIMASIIEKETARPDERPRIAAVFINRLNNGMRLQSDPTVIYGLTGGKPLGRAISISDLQSETPYNTYVVAGLPPMPICNPGRAALAAALDPPSSTELYFVADGSGGHAFSSTLDAHHQNVDRWRAIETARNDCRAATPPGRPPAC
jgi:UPF0755 protein